MLVAQLDRVSASEAEGRPFKSGRAHQFFDICLTEPFPIKGFIGAWPVLAPIFEKFCAENPQFKLNSIAGLNSKSDEIGQVGGVFTPKEKRKHGYAKATMLHLLKDCRDFHGHAKSILFTGETDLPAQKLYESIGYERIGHFALILS